MKKILFILLISFHTAAFAQVGIGTNTPHNSAILDITAIDKGILFPKMTSTQRTAIASPATGLHVFDTGTNSLWLFNGSIWVNTASAATYGDIKSGIQTNDHSGWVKLDGRATSSSTLSATQRAVLTSLGISGNLPNASSAYPVQNGTTLGSVSGANTTTLVQANLPLVNFTGTAAAAGNHTHTTNNTTAYTSWDGYHNHGSNASGGTNPGLQYQSGWNTPTSLDNNVGGGEDDLNYTTALDIYGNGNHQHSVNIPSVYTSYPGDHSHSVTVSSGGSSTPINIAPKSLSVNMFIYLGF